MWSRITSWRWADVHRGPQARQRRGHRRDGYRLIMNCNRHGGQEVYHIHLHLVGGEPWDPC